MIYIGIDTSNYTTSVAAMGDNIHSLRKLLYVKQGERGIRQSDGVFQHMKLLPKLYDELVKIIDLNDVGAVGVSVKPRNVEGSYMPVFLAGYGYAQVIADTLNVPLIEFSHQDGHIMAGVFSSMGDKLLDNEFISVHLSGGTTEILKSRYENGRFENEIIGGTKDISAGQYIDRVGVRLGMSFPAGKHMEEAANQTENAIKLPVSTSGTYMNFSGSETKAIRMADSCDAGELSRGVLISVAQALIKTINNALCEYGLNNVLMVGGVASNTIIRKLLDENIEGNVYFANKEYSTDNALGIAVMTKKFAEMGYGTKNRYSFTDKSIR